MGDFNFPHINWNTYDSDAASVSFINLVMDNYLSQYVKEPTRESNLLDLVLTSEEAMVENVEVLEHLGNSDHNIVKWIMRKCVLF